MNTIGQTNTKISVFVYMLLCHSIFMSSYRVCVCLVSQFPCLFLFVIYSPCLCFRHCPFLCETTLGFTALDFMLLDSGADETEALFWFLSYRGILGFPIKHCCMWEERFGLTKEFHISFNTQDIYTGLVSFTQSELLWIRPEVWEIPVTTLQHCVMQWFFCL